MGSSCSRCTCGHKEKDHYRCVIVGLDGAGKTTLFNYICDKNQGEKQAISGFEICTCKHDNFIFDFWDTNGDKRCRQFWTHYIFGAYAVIFVVDSTERDRFPEVKEELTKLLQCEGTENLLWLIVASKLDSPGHVPGAEISASLSLPELFKDRNWKLFAKEKAKPPINEYLQFLASSLHKQDSTVFCIHNKHTTNTSCIDRVFLRSIEETRSQVPSKWLDTISLTDSRKDP